MTGEWMTYAQIGERFGLKSEAARTRVRRLGWRTMPGNDGRTLALVPEDADRKPDGDHAARPDDDRADDDGDDRTVTAMLTGLLTEATARGDRAEQRADEANRRADDALAVADRTLAQLADAEARIGVERARADRAETAIAGERQRADALRDRVVTAEVAQREAEEAAGLARSQATEAQRRACDLAPR